MLLLNGFINIGKVFKLKKYLTKRKKHFKYKIEIKYMKKKKQVLIINLVKHSNF